MNESLIQIVSQHQSQLVERDAKILRENLARLENKCKLELHDLEPNEAKVLRCLWLELSTLSVKLRNPELCMIVAAKLKLFQLVLLLRTLLAQRPTQIREAIALSYAKSLFHADQLQDPIDAINEDQIKSCQPSDFQELIEFYVNSDKWDRALEYTEVRYRFDEKCCQVKRNLILHRLAQHLEAEENFADAITYYEKAKSPHTHITRLLMKQNLQSSHRHLRKYCDQRKSMQKVWNDYLQDSGNHQELREWYLVTGNRLGIIQCDTLRSNRKEIDQLLADVLAKSSLEFVTDKSSSKWTNKRKLDLIASFGSSLASTSREAIAELARYYERILKPEVSTSLLLHLEQVDLLINRLGKSSGNLSAIKLASQYGGNHLVDATSQLIDYLLQKQPNKAPTGNHNTEQMVLFESLSKLGLMEESLVALTFDNESLIHEVVKFLEFSIEGQAQGTLDYIDPELGHQTLISLKLSIMNNSNNSILSTNAIVIVILCTTILLRKLENSRQSYQDHVSQVSKLEVMFQHLADYSTSLNLVASEELVKTTSNLIGALKEKLDLLADSKTIRESFRQLVEEAASRCMVEAKYKSAAILYSQIEDNVSAVKSLMRTGDVDVVIDYSLLVKDITVNRITINYLKHLRVDAEIIDDFTSKCNS